MNCWICCVVLLGSFGPVAVAGDKPGTQAKPVATEKPGTNPKLVAAGIERLAKLKRMSPGTSVSYDFEIKHGPEEPIGYAAVTVTARRDGETLVYDYTNFGTVLFPTGDKLVSDITARLKPNFEPIEIDLWTARISPSGEMQDVVNRAIVEKGKSVHTASSGGQSETHDVPRPRPPFIYAIVSVAAQLDPIPGERFVLREFDARQGGARDLRFDVEVWKDGTATAVTTTRQGTTSYEFWYNEDNVLIRWTEATIPAMFIRVNKPRLEELKKQFGVTRRPAVTIKKKASGTTDKPKP